MQQVWLELSDHPPPDQPFAGRLLLGLENHPDAKGVFPVQFPPLQWLRHAYQEWAQAYRQCAQLTRLGAVGNQVTNISSPSPLLLQTLREKHQQVLICLNQWLNETRVNDLSNHGDDPQASCFGLGNFIYDPFQGGEPRHLIVQTANLELWQYPWHEWLPIRFEVIFSPRYYPPLRSTNLQNRNIRILAILGQGQGLELEQDLQALQRLPHVELRYLNAPTPEELVPLWQESWDILFYAGHSKKGILEVDCPLEIRQIRETLTHAAHRGLQLAIFNSCESIDLAENLVQLGVPHAIGMREVIPDLVAQKFLHYFLNHFQQDKEDLYSAVTKARLQLRELMGLEHVLPGTCSLPLICRHPQARCLTWKHLKLGSHAIPTPVREGTPSPQGLRDWLYWCRRQLDEAQQQIREPEEGYNPLFYQTGYPLQRWLPNAFRPYPEAAINRQAIDNVVHWACGLLKTVGSTGNKAQLRFFFAALQREAEAVVSRSPLQPVLDALQSLAEKRQGIHSTHAAILRMRREPTDAHLLQALTTFDQVLRGTKEPALKTDVLEQLQQFLIEVEPSLLEKAWKSTEGTNLGQFLRQLAGNSQAPNRLRLAAATVMGFAKGVFAQEASEIALTTFRNSSYLEDVITASRCLRLLNIRLWEVEARLVRFLQWATVQSHQVALCRALGLVHPGHPKAIQTLETLVQQQAYDTDTLLSAVRALQRIAPDHPLPHQTLEAFVTKARATDEPVDFYLGLALMQELHYTIEDYLNPAVASWMAAEIAVMEARQDPYLEAPYTVLWYCVQHLPRQEVEKIF